MIDFENYDHDIYKHCDEKEADAIAWGFVNNGKMVKFPFKFPSIGPTEIRANVLYSGLCHTDLGTVREHWGFGVYPIVPGHEIIGEVSAVGKEVTEFKKGDLVGFGPMRTCCEKCFFCKEGREVLCEKIDVQDLFTYGNYWGGYATQIQQPANFFFHLPDKFNIKTGAPLLCAGITSFNAIKKYLKPYMKTAVVGIGGLGHLAVKFLQKMKHNVIAITSSLDKSELIKSLGANEIVCINDTKAMQSIEGKVDFLINTSCVNSGFEDLVRLMRNGGFMVQLGIPELANNNVSIPCVDLVCREISLVGNSIGPRNAIKEMITFCTEKDVYPIVEEFSFEDFPKAFEKLEKGKPMFRCVVNVHDYSKKNGFFK